MARLEQEKVQRPMREQPKGEVVFSRKLTLRDLLKIEPEEEGEQKPPLRDIPFDFEVRDLGDSLLYTASFSETQPVSLWELHPLLAAAKPGGQSRNGQGPLDIEADWQIILPEVRKREPESERLYSFHKQHVPGFLEFEKNHFELFWKVLESGIRRSESVEFFDEQFNQFIDEREFFAKYGRQRDFSNDIKIEDLALVWSKSFVPFLEAKGFRIPYNPDPKVPEPFRAEINNFFYSLGEQERRSLAIEFYKESVDEEGVRAELEFGDYLRLSEGPSMTTLIGENGDLSRIGRNGKLKPFDVYLKERPRYRAKELDSFKRLTNGQIELIRGESFIRMSIVEGQDGYKKVKLEDHALPTPETIVPFISWQTDKKTGKKSYYCGKLDQFPKHDTLLGQLVVSAYSPQVRDQMPLEIKMRGKDGREITQQMLEAQTILLVPRFENKFLTQSPVILGFEQLASQGK